MDFLNDIKSKSILVIGDVMLDIYYDGDIERISPEAPVPVFRKKGERSVLGGAANVAANLVAANQIVSMMTMIGNDENGKRLMASFIEKGINTEFVVSLNRNTTVKTRFLANNQQVLRMDIEDTNDLDNEECKALLKILKEKMYIFDMVLISDYLKGMLSYEFTQGILSIAREMGIPVIIDVKDSKYEKYQGAYLLKPNLKELRCLTGMEALEDKGIIAASEKLRKLCRCDYVLTTCGARGMVLVSESEPYFVPSVGQEVFDVTGAGDTTIAYLAACLVNGCPIKAAVDIANYAAGLQVAKVGTSSVYWLEVRALLSDSKEKKLKKIMFERSVYDFRKRNQNKRIVFTNGCFDILHIGHIRYLQEAAKLGDLLMVGLNSDASVKRIKGSERPVNNEQERAELLCALDCVDHVVIFEEDSPFELIELLQPDILCKGGDYINEYVIGTDIVEAKGGKLVIIPLVEGKSTTNIIKKLRKENAIQK